MKYYYKIITSNALKSSKKRAFLATMQVANNQTVGKQY